MRIPSTPCITKLAGWAAALLLSGSAFSQPEPVLDMEPAARGQLILLSSNRCAQFCGTYVPQEAHFDRCLPPLPWHRGELSEEHFGDFETDTESCGFLEQAGLWVGALRATVEGLEVPRVSFAEEGWERHVCEFWPGAGPEAELQAIRRSPGTDCVGSPLPVDPQLLGDECLRSQACDTLTSFPRNFTYDQQDGDHQPLGLQIQQEVHTWSVTPGLEDVALICCTITNIGEDPLLEPYAGLCLLPNAHHSSELAGSNQLDPAADDICWYREELVDPEGGTRHVPMALFSDNDGRVSEHSAGELNGARHVFAVLPLTSEGPSELSFNWYHSSSNPEQDYGPAWASCLQNEDLAWTGTLGTPEADADKYWLMRNGEHDPAMWECTDGASLDPQNLPDGNSEAWQTPAHELNPQGNLHSAVVSAGPLGSLVDGRTVLAPGASVELAFAMVIGRDFHTNSDPGVHFGDWDYTDLDAKICRLLDRWQGTLTPPLQPELALEVLEENRVELNWSSEIPGASFSLQRIDLHTGELIQLLDGSDLLHYTDTVVRGDSLCYTLSACTADGICNSSEELALVGYPSIYEYSVTPEVDALRVQWQSDGEEMMLIRKRYGLLLGESRPQFNTIAESDTLLLVGSSHTYEGLQALERVVLELRARNGDLLSDPVEAGAFSLPVPESNQMSCYYIYLDTNLNTAEREFCRDQGEDLAAALGFDYSFVSAPVIGGSVDSDLYESMCRGDVILLSTPLGDDQSGPGVIVGHWYADLLGAFAQAGGKLLLGNHSCGSIEYTTVLQGDYLQYTLLPGIDLDHSEVGQLCELSPGAAVMLDDGTSLPLRDNLLAELSIDELELFAGHFDSTVLPGVGHRGQTNANTGLEGLAALQFSSGDTWVLHTRLPFYCFENAAFEEYCRTHLGLFATDLDPHSSEVHPQNFSLEACVPNPFNPTTEVHWKQFREARVRISVFNLLGQEVEVLCDEVRAAGEHQLSFDGQALASGVYVLQMAGAGECTSQKMLLVK